MEEFHLRFDELQSFQLRFGEFQSIIINTGDYPIYDGITTVRPTSEEQTLSTKETVVLSDITVQRIPISDVSNDSGGITITIG